MDSINLIEKICLPEKNTAVLPFGEGGCHLGVYFAIELLHALIYRIER